MGLAPGWWVCFVLTRLIIPGLTGLGGDAYLWPVVNLRTDHDGDTSALAAASITIRLDADHNGLGSGAVGCVWGQAA